MNSAFTAKGAPSLAKRAHNIRRHALRMGQVQGQGYIGPVSYTHLTLPTICSV